MDTDLTQCHHCLRWRLNTVPSCTCQNRYPKLKDWLQEIPKSETLNIDHFTQNLKTPAGRID
ncbi:MAG: hypothetical protein P1U89_08380 [Verrucomicrobiales bacterium]|nr:hypothetical protein [Verrucomicrobiales bacterium]